MTFAAAKRRPPRSRSTDVPGLELGLEPVPDDIHRFNEQEHGQDGHGRPGDLVVRPGITDGQQRDAESNSAADRLQCERRAHRGPSGAGLPHQIADDNFPEAQRRDGGEQPDEGERIAHDPEWLRPQVACNPNPHDQPDPQPHDPVEQEPTDVVHDPPHVVSVPDGVEKGGEEARRLPSHDASFCLSKTRHVGLFSSVGLKAANSSGSTPTTGSCA